MTTIGSTANYASTTRYGGIETPFSSNADDAYAISTQEGRGKTSDPQSSSQTETIVDTRPSTATVNFQGKLVILNRLDISGLKATPIWEMSEDFYQSIVDSRELILEAKYRQVPEAPDLSNYAGTKTYANVVVGGKVVATIDNQGGVSTDDVLGQKLRDILLGDVNGTNGPDLAQARAEQIAKLLGGRVVGSDTALTQAEFNALPKPEEPQPWIDYDAMRADPEYDRIQDLKRKREEYLASQQASAAIQV